MKIPFVAAKLERTAFNCPHCTAYAKQDWMHPYQTIPATSLFEQGSKPLRFSRCTHCGELAVWWHDVMMVPDASPAPIPHSDLPESLRSDYEEARTISSKSPRSAAALLRLCIQKLCKELGESGKDINADIASLVAKGLPLQVQRSLDIVRVVGNEQVHPGTLDVRDDPGIVVELFELINFIIEDRIARPKAIDDLYMRLPESKRKGIEKRDGAAPADNGAKLAVNDESK
jgi:hypothetical protein